MTMGPADQVLALFSSRGHEHHGEVIDQQSHALQSAVLAQAVGADDALVVAALLHDIGHLVAAAGHGPRSDRSIDDDHHEAVGARWVAPRFGPIVARPIALHVVAKRYRCTVDPAYFDTLSPTSIETLQAQGGLLDTEAVARFEAHRGHADALALRGWDEAAKDPHVTTVGLDEFRALLQRVAITEG